MDSLVPVCTVTEQAERKGKRGKRAPSEYNLHMSSCMKGKKGQVTERFKACVSEWKSKKK